MPADGALRAAVIGSGFGGLAAAIRLQSRGVAVTLFEARDQPGGRAYVYRDAGFTFDAGPTVITAPHCLEELFALAGRKLADYVELLPVDPFYRLQWEDGTSFDYVGDPARIREQIRALSPADVAGYDRFAAYAERVFAKGYEELGAVPFLRFWDMVRVAPQLAALRADRSVYATVARFIKDERLRQAFSFHSLLVGGDPFATSAIYTLIHHLEKKWGVYFPRGGTGALVAALVKLFCELGGELRLSTPVAAIRLESQNGSGPRGVKHWVRPERGDEEPFDLVVSNADLRHTYGDLLAGEPAAARMLRQVEKMKWSMSLFVLYFGTDRRHPGLAHHTILFGPRYRELLREIFAGPDLPEDFSLYLHAPTVTDPSLAPSGCEAFYVLSPVPHLAAAPIDWESEGPRYADRILAHLERRLPDLRKHVVVRRLFTPRDFERELRTYHGSAFSVAPLLTQSAWFRPHNRDPRIPGLYLVGAGTHPGAGVPGVVNSAKATVGLVAEDFGC
ncbi:MAG TPA: phytoene desaturase [Planctomycetia bacterium]|nr:phytoene desaturase [Planctomycetia bacterium]